MRPSSPESDLTKSIARNAFLQRHPGQEMWFKLGWRCLSDGSPPSPASRLVSLPEGLAVAGSDATLSRAIELELAILFETAMVRFPAVEEEVIAQCALTIQ